MLSLCSNSPAIIFFQLLDKYFTESKEIHEYSLDKKFENIIFTCITN